MSRLQASALLLLFFAVSGCHGPGRVEFTGGQCVIDGQIATRAEVESRQAHITERILSRQPMFVLITVLIVALAGMSHVEKLFLFFGGKHGKPVHGMHDRLRLALDRYRAYPLRYFSIVAATLGLLGAAAGVYVYLDADKRASERALGLLQFCHIALRNNEAESILAEQRHNLEQIESTAGNIRALVGKLPPEERQKAREIVAHISDALQQQGKLVGDYATRTDESTRAVRAETQALGKGLTSLETQVTTLQSIPAALRELGDQVHAVDAHLTAGVGAVQAGLSANDARLAAVEARLDAATARLVALDGVGKAAVEHKAGLSEPVKPNDSPPPPRLVDGSKVAPPDLGMVTAARSNEHAAP